MTAQPLGADDVLFAHVFQSPQRPPGSIMLQWLGPDGWEHRTYWGNHVLPWGTQGTPSRHDMGPLPFTDEWVRLEVPVAAVALSGKHVTGMAFTLYDGEVAWDYAGVRLPAPAPPPPPPLRASVTPPTTTEGTRQIRINAIDQSGARILGRVHLVQQWPNRRHRSHNVAITKEFDRGKYLLLVRCPGYPEVALPFTVLPPKRFT